MVGTKLRVPSSSEVGIGLVIRSKGANYAHPLVDHRRAHCRLADREDHEGAGYGIIGGFILGILGAVIGGFIMRSMGFAGQGGLLYTILVALGGAVVLTAVVRVLKTA